MDNVEGSNGEKQDWEWELRKSNRRFFDIMDEIDAINKKIKALNGKIYRLQQQLKGDVEEYVELTDRALTVPEEMTKEEVEIVLKKAALAKYYNEIL